MDQLHIDIGARDAADAGALVRVGDVAVIAGDPVELPNGRVVARALDNRLGCFVALEAARLVAEAGGAPGDVVAVAAVQEETAFGGSTTTAYALRPDVALVVDVTHATDAPGIDKHELGAHPFGSGPVIERGSNLNPRVSDLLLDVAEAQSIPFTIQASARYTGTDADAVHVSRGGVPDRLHRPAAALHALARRDGAARGRRALGRADRRLRAAPGRRDQLPAVRLLALLCAIVGLSACGGSSSGPNVHQVGSGTHRKDVRPAQAVAGAAGEADRAPARGPARDLPVQRAHAAAGAAEAHPPRRGGRRAVPRRQPRHARAGARAHAHAAARAAPGGPAGAAAADGRPGGRQREAPARRTGAQRAADGRDGPPVGGPRRGARDGADAARGGHERRSGAGRRRRAARERAAQRGPRLRLQRARGRAASAPRSPPAWARGASPRRPSTSPASAPPSPTPTTARCGSPSTAARCSASTAARSSPRAGPTCRW